MKKNLLLAALVLPLLSVSAQWTQVGGTVSVKPNTLKYVAQDYKVSGVGSKTTNEGNVNVRGNFTIDNATEPTTEFRNKFNSGTQYGQLIINENSTAVGKVVGEFRNTSENVYYNQPLAVPFKNITAAEIASMSGITSPTWVTYSPSSTGFDPNRYKNSVFMWLNQDYALKHLSQFDEVGVTTNVNPTNYFSINQGFNDLVVRDSEYSGNPANIAHSLDLTRFSISPGTESQVNNYSRNIYGEMLGTYLKDPFVQMDYGAWATAGRVNADDDFGRNIFMFGNPYTSNLSLLNIDPTGIRGISQPKSTLFNPNINGGNANITFTDPLVIIWDGNQWTGDEEALEVRPFHTFTIKTNNSQDLMLSLNDSNKTFELTSYGAPVHDYTSRNLNDLSFSVKLELFKEDNAIGRSYIVASSSYESAATEGNEAYHTNLSDEVDAIYTFQENSDGTIAQELVNSKTYINGINKNSYIAKPIYLAHQVVTPGNYTFKGILSESLLNSGNDFYFEDIEEGFIQNITEDFEYTFTANETTTDRFRIYWNGTPEVLNVSDVTSVAKTLVYKNVDDTFKVRFAEHWNKADIFVYNVMGQLVHSAKSVDASIDYPLPLKGQTSAYIVKAVSDKGEVATQKIIKK